MRFRTSAVAMVVLSLAGTAGAQVVETQCAYAYIFVYEGYHMYETKGCVSGQLTTEVHGYTTQLTAGQLGCCGTTCNAPTPQLVIEFLPPNLSKASKQGPAANRLSTSSLQSLFSALSNAKGIGGKTDLKNPKLKVYFDDLVVKTTSALSTDPIYFSCLCAVYESKPNMRIPISVAVQIPEPSDGHDGIGKLMVDLNTFKLRLLYEVEIGLGRRKTRKTLNFTVGMSPLSKITPQRRKPNSRSKK